MASIEDDSHLIKLEDSGMLKSLTKNFEQSLIPMILLNSRQKIIFCNTTFSQDIVRQAEVRGLSLFQIVDPFDNAEKALNIQQALRLGETGFSWRGQIRFSHKKFLNTETNALISPIFPEDSGQDPPVGHLCLFDNVTEDNRAIIHKTFQSLLEASKMKDKRYRLPYSASRKLLTDHGSMAL